MENEQFNSSTPHIIYPTTIISTMATESSAYATKCPEIPESPVMAAAVSQATSSILTPSVQPLLLQRDSVRNPVPPTAIIGTNAFGSSRASELQRGVIYALNHYSPFISIPRASTAHPSQNGNCHSGNNLGPEDVAEVRQMTSAIAATSFHEHTRRSEAGKCQSGGELRLSELSHKLNNLHIAEGFALVGAKSPMLTGMMLVAAVDKRYLPGEKDSLTTPGFSGNCIGCGATGFRYFTEFSTHINLKLATQPKKQKHLKCYIIQTEDGKWGRGPLIPWKGTENKKRSHLYQNRNPIQLLPSLTDFPQKFAEFHHKSNLQEVNAHSNTARMPTIISNDDEPPVKKAKVANEDEQVELSQTKDDLLLDDGTVDDGKDSVEELPVTSTNQQVDDSLERLNRSISILCGVRPVLLLCQDLSSKLPNSVNDLIVSDLLVGCFDFPDRLFGKAETETVFQYCSSVMSTGVSTVETSTVGSSREHNVANTLVSMGSVSIPSEEMSMEQYKNKPWPSVAERLKEAATTTLPLNAAIILFTQYLCSLDDKCINKEQIELLLNKARIEMSTSTITSLFSASQTVAATRTQLSLMINLQCSASNGRVRVMTSNISFQNALYKALQWLNETFYISKVANKKMNSPNFIIILSTPATSSIEFGVLVTGVSHAKILAECLGINSIECSNFQESLLKLQNQYSPTDSAMSKMLEVYEVFNKSKVHASFNAYSGEKIDIELAKMQQPKCAPVSAKPFRARGDVFSNQAAMAHQLLKQLRNVAENPDVLDLASFLHVDICIVVPATESLYYMTVKRLCESGILHLLGLETESVLNNYEIGEKYVIMYSDWSEAIHKWNKFVQNTQTNPDTLHILIFDQAQRYTLPQGMPDVLPNLKQIFESINVIPVFVTSVPYIFQTNRSFIDPDNEVYWTDTHQSSAVSKYIDDERIVINDQQMLYFGIKELCDSTRWNQQYALIRSEETFDSALPKANRLNDINYSIVQGYILLRLYQASLMVSAGIKTAEPYAVMSFITMVTDIVESPLRNTDGSGSMLMIRIPKKQLGKRFQEVLTKTRNSLGMQYRFDVIFDDAEHELEIEDHFLERMRQWRRMKGWSNEEAAKWKPKCLEELLDLPCFLILSGEQRAGETFPRSLKYADFNIINHSKFHRATIEAEIGSCSCYLNTTGSKPNESITNIFVANNTASTLENPLNKDDSCDGLDEYGQYSHQEKCEGCLSEAHQPNGKCSRFSSKYPSPIILVSKPLWLMLNSEQGGTRGLVHLNSDPNTRWIRSNRPLLMTTKPDRISRYYRRWTEPRPARKVLTTPAAPSVPPSPEHSVLDAPHSKVADILSLESKRSREKSSCNSQQEIDHEDKDDLDADREQYHPRCFLFSGPPQAGKTGSYLYFAYLLHRMLLRLKRVDVYDNCITYTPSSYSTLSENEDVTNWKFASDLLDMRREKFSPILTCSRENETHNPVIASIREEGSDKALVILAKTALYDTLHHCDVCKVYREGIGNMVAQLFNYSVAIPGGEYEVVKLQVVIPPIHLKYFEVDEEIRVINKLIIPTYDEDSKRTSTTTTLSVKSPIFMMSTMGEEEGLLNLFHGMEETDHIHITFIRSRELHQYQKQWPNHIFAALPDDLDKASDSIVKNVMKCFASQNFKSNDDARINEQQTGGKTWPYVLFVPDNLVMWQKYWKGTTCYSSDSDEELHEKNERHSNGSVRDSITRNTASLLEFLLAVESNTTMLQYALIGVRPWSSYQDEADVPSCIRTFTSNCFLLDVNKTRNVNFSDSIYYGENVDFHLKLLEENLATCRYEHFTFMCKVTLRSKWVGKDTLMPGMEALSNEEIISKLVVQPDRETMKVLDANSHHVFQKYLKYAGSKLFQLAVKDSKHPVLVIGGYLNLGPSIRVCVVNHGNLKEKILTSEYIQAKQYAGIVLYNCSKKLSKECFTRLKFLKSAQLLFVCQERYELRNEAQRLDLEEDWRFRLLDEYQTATRTQNGRKTLYFLTGSYIS